MIKNKVILGHIVFSLLLWGYTGFYTWYRAPQWIAVLLPLGSFFAFNFMVISWYRVTDGLKLEIEPIPISSWGISLASRLPKEEWDDLRTKVYRDADYKCEICGNGEEQLHCHEQWAFDDKRSIQKLVRCICLCKTCHDVKHLGRSKEVYGKGHISLLVRHWCKINKRLEQDFYMYEKEIFTLNKKRADKFYVIKVGRRILV